MGGAAVRLPCFPNNPKRVVSPYDKGFIPNIVDFMHSSILWWWFPTRPYDDYDGLQFDQVPKVTQDEYRLHFGKDAQNMTISIGGQSNEAKLRGRTVDYQAIIKEAEAAVDQKNLQFAAFLLQYGQRKDNSYQPQAPMMMPQNPMMNMSLGNFQSPFGQFGSFA